MRADITYLFQRMLSHLESNPELSAFLAIYIVIMLVSMIVVMLVGVACYVMNAIAVMKMAQKREIDRAWLAWIPFASTYLFGKISETPEKKRKTAKVLLLLQIGYTVFSGIYAGAVIVLVGMISKLGYDGGEETGVILTAVVMVLFFVLFLTIAIAYTVIYYMAFYRICKLFGGAQFMVYFLLGLIPTVLGIAITMPIALLVLSSKKMDDTNMFPKPPVPRWGEQPYAQPPQNTEQIL